VRDFLVSQGVPDSRLSTISYGKERPIEICSNEACYQQNRRAVTVVSAGAGV
jgi:peptidoglycan-associated lipoprotein